MLIACSTPKRVRNVVAFAAPVTVDAAMGAAAVDIHPAVLFPTGQNSLCVNKMHAAYPISAVTADFSEGFFPSVSNYFSQRL